MENFDVYDDCRIKTGKICERGTALGHNENRVVVHACLFNDNGEMLIQQRHKDKDFFAGLWDFSCGGGAIAGESSRMSAKRELEEELGINYDFSNERPYFTVNFKNGFDDYFFVDANIEINEVKYQKEEIQAVKWANKTEILNLLENNEFVPYSEHLIGLLFDYKNGIGRF